MRTAISLGSEIHASSTAVQSQYVPDIEIVPGTGFLVAWREGSGSALYDEAWETHAQMFDFSGVSLGSEFSLDPVSGESQNIPDLAALSNGALVVGLENLDPTLLQRHRRSRAACFSLSLMEQPRATNSRERRIAISTWATRAMTSFMGRGVTMALTVEMATISCSATVATISLSAAWATICS